MASTTTARWRRVVASVRPTGEDHRVTPLELFFDLVFVYAVTNVTAFLEHHLDRTGVVDGIILLLLIWFGWCAYAWLGNQAQADEGLVRLGVIVAMAGMFVVAVSLPYAFEPDGEAATVLVAGYAVVRLTHLAVYWVAAGEDRQLRSVISGMAGIATTMLVLLVIGVVDADHRTWWWLAAVIVDQVGVYVVRSNRWRLPSPAHFAERFGLIIIIALGESVVALGTTVESPALAWRQAVALLSGFAIAVALWWLYFDVVAVVAERVLRAASPADRIRLARDSYTYLHLPMVGGIVFAALGMVLLVLDEGHVDGGRRALYGGAAVYLLAHLGFRWRNVGSINVPRAITIVVLVVGAVVLGGLAPTWQLAVAAAVLVTLVAVEVTRFATARDVIRHG